jgi:hypothetical protein
MLDESRRYRQYHNELTRIYKEFDPFFDNKSLNFDLTDPVLGLLQIKDVALPAINSFIERHKQDIKQIINPDNGLLFQQPVCILVQYYFINHISFLKNHWPLSNESLKSVYLANGTSFENY